jgi:MFS transporter, LPLT family, lysophospholipid transporter
VLKWAEKQLGLPLSQGAILQGVVAVGIAVGAVMAARRVPLQKSLSVLPFGVAMGLVVISMTLVTSTWAAYPLLILVGAMAGYFVVPMNALLQHRGHVLLSAGHSIAVQNFNENLNILIMLCMYALMINANFDIRVIIILFGLFVSGTMVAVIYWNRANQAKQDLSHLIGEAKH